MEIIDFGEIKQKIIKFKGGLSILRGTLNIDSKENNLKELENKTLNPKFWDSSDSQTTLQKIKEIKKVMDKYNELDKKLEYIEELYEILLSDRDDSLEEELTTILLEYKKKYKALEMEALLNGEYDNSNAIITIHPGAGGTESQDWTNMLYRMYTKWCERNNMPIEVFDYQDGEEAGVKSVTFLVKGMNAYGYLKGEMGVHRLVRISPFDSNSRRHTSFAAVDVMPEIDDKIELNIKDEEIEIDTYRASGAGGQHINKTDSAVRIRHIPSGTVVTCQTERSQFQNKENAMKMLKAKLYQLELKKNKDRVNEIRGETSDNSWGNQIRSYVFCPYTLVKDHRTNFEIGNVQKVMDGYIDELISEYLLFISK